MPPPCNPNYHRLKRSSLFQDTQMGSMIKTKHTRTHSRTHTRTHTHTLFIFFSVCRIDTQLRAKHHRKLQNVEQNLPPRFNLYHSLGIFSRRQTDDIFLIFSRKQDLTFQANCLLRRQFAWNVKSCFLGIIRKIFQNVVCWKFYPECKALNSARPLFDLKCAVHRPRRVSNISKSIKYNHPDIREIYNIYFV